MVLAQFLLLKPRFSVYFQSYMKDHIPINDIITETSTILFFVIDTYSYIFLKPWFIARSHCYIDEDRHQLGN